MTQEKTLQELIENLELYSEDDDSEYIGGPTNPNEREKGKIVKSKTMRQKITSDDFEKLDLATLGNLLDQCKNELTQRGDEIYAQEIPEYQQPKSVSLDLALGFFGFDGVRSQFYKKNASIATDVTIRNTELNDVKNVKLLSEIELKKMTNLTFNGCGIASYKVPDGLKSLQIISNCRSRFETSPDIVIKNVENLECLRVDKVYFDGFKNVGSDTLKSIDCVSNVKSDEIKYLRNLEELSLTSLKLSTKRPKDQFSKLKSLVLKELHIHPLDTLHTPNLTTLMIRKLIFLKRGRTTNNQINERTGNMFEKLKNLKEFIVRSSQIMLEDPTPFENVELFDYGGPMDTKIIKNMKKIKDITIHSTEIGRNLFKKGTTLETLRFHRCSFESEKWSDGLDYCEQIVISGHDVDSLDSLSFPKKYGYVTIYVLPKRKDMTIDVEKVELFREKMRKNGVVNLEIALA